MKHSTIAPAYASAGIVATADEELATINSERQAVVALLSQSGQELADIAHRLEEMATQQAHTGQQLAQAHESAHKAQIWAEVTQELPSGATSLADLKAARANYPLTR